MKVEEINPYQQEGEKGRQIEQMFDSIAPSYDFMNTAMSFGLHKRWRNVALKRAIASMSANSQGAAGDILDVATGTGDVAIKLARLLPESMVTGIDLSEGMLNEARKKAETLPSTLSRRLTFGKADCLMLPYHDDAFAMVTVAYGVRNFSDLRRGISEMRRVIAPGGVLCIIELSSPQGKVTKGLYNVYSRRIIPALGRMVSKDTRAYSYLPESIAACPQRDEMAALLKECGFTHVEWKSLSFGAVTYYIAK